jgi:hypothetical protein
MRRLGLAPITERLEAASTNDWFQTVTERLNTYSGASTPAASSIPQNQWIVFYNTTTGLASLITNRGGVVVSTTLTPAVSVVSETAFGQASTVGTSLNYARQDHTHGTPSSIVGLTGTKAQFNTAVSDGDILYVGDITTTTEGALINGATAKTTPVDADYIGLMDSAASNILKKLSWANIKATLKTYFDGLYASIAFDPGSITIATETGLVQASVLKLTGSEVATVNGTGQLVIVGVY